MTGTSLLFFFFASLLIKYFVSLHPQSVKSTRNTLYQPIKTTKNEKRQHRF